ncbi:hypothetical protein C9374_012995 [Naegleria lovaniensis]|uniref:Zn(2)-C6 fungal-type domain-containing protein n=1 Tax=Naegleria lovaniensis TaxID=51637 RepID=A0AA88KBB4_NAELO|nr:uncharacterized protein C9374_012995 [Naegleria lovaniensis]KAG2372965.1 hypothetical protein C9374_012995 [Naegleria lovaniensis]
MTDQPQQQDVADDDHVTKTDMNNNSAATIQEEEEQQQYPSTITTSSSSSSSPCNDQQQQQQLQQNDSSQKYHPIACEACRKKHKKCDRTLPCCIECTRRGLNCVYYEPKKEYLQKMMQEGIVVRPQKPLTKKPKDFQVVSFRVESPRAQQNTFTHYAYNPDISGLSRYDASGGQSTNFPSNFIQHSQEKVKTKKKKKLMKTQSMTNPTSIIPPQQSYPTQPGILSTLISQTSTNPSATTTTTAYPSTVYNQTVPTTVSQTRYTEPQLLSTYETTNNQNYLSQQDTLPTSTIASKYNAISDNYHQPTFSNNSAKSHDLSITQQLSTSPSHSHSTSSLHNYRYQPYNPPSSVALQSSSVTAATTSLSPSQKPLSDPTSSVNALSVKSPRVQNSPRSNLTHSSHSDSSSNKEGSDASSSMHSLFLQDLLNTSYMKINTFEYYHRYVVYGFRLFSQELIEQTIFGEDLKVTMSDIFRNPNCFFQHPEFSKHTNESIQHLKKSEILSLLYTVHAVVCSFNGYQQQAETSIRRSFEISYRGSVFRDILQLFYDPSFPEELVGSIVLRHGPQNDFLIQTDRAFYSFRLGRFLLSALYALSNANLGLAKYFLLKSDEMLDNDSPNFKSRRYINYSVSMESKEGSDYSIFAVPDLQVISFCKFRITTGMSYDNVRNYLQRGDIFYGYENSIPKPLVVTKTSSVLRDAPEFQFDHNVLRMMAGNHVINMGKLPMEILLITTLRNITVDNIELFLMLNILVLKEGAHYMFDMKIDPITISYAQSLRKFTIYSVLIDLLSVILENLPYDEEPSVGNPTVARLENIFKNFDEAVAGGLSENLKKWNFSNLTEYELEKLREGSTPNEPSIFSLLSSRDSTATTPSSEPTSVRATVEKLLTLYCDRFADNLREFSKETIIFNNGDMLVLRTACLVHLRQAETILQRVPLPLADRMELANRLHPILTTEFNIITYLQQKFPKIYFRTFSFSNRLETMLERIQTAISSGAQL